MNALVVLVAALVALAAAKPYHHDDVILKGPSGVITSHGPIGPEGPAHGGYAHYEEENHYDDGQYHGEHHGYDDGQYHGEGAYHGAVHAPGVAIIAPAAHYYAAPAHHGYGHHDGYVAYGHHGVAVKGPHTVPAVVAGPAGKIVADGLYGVPHHGHHY